MSNDKRCIFANVCKSEFVYLQRKGKSQGGCDWETR